MLIKPLTPHQALFLHHNSERVLVIADLHIGWEATLAQKGVHVPSQTPKLLKKILQVIKSCKPTRLIFLGDVKHTIARAKTEEWRDIPNFFEVIGKKISDIQIVPGNHDGNLSPLLPETVKILPSTGVAIGSTGLFHGHAWMAPKLLECNTLITGHLHPMVAFRDPMGFQIRKQIWVKAKCDSARLATPLLAHLRIKNKDNPATQLYDHFKVRLKTSKLVIMPSFNEFLGGKTINKRIIREEEKPKIFIGPLLRSGSINIADAEIYLLDGTYLGTVNQMKNIG